jgi:hypothetical protein
MTTIAAGLHAHSWARDIHGVLGIREVGQYLLLWRQVESIPLTNQPDQLLWRWTANGAYSAKSCYLAMFHGSKACAYWKLLWKTWAPPRVKFFHWLAAKDRCWTAERLRRRGLQHHPRCLLCDQEPETMQHILLACSFSRQVWYDILAWLRLTCNPPVDEASLSDWWIIARQNTPKPMHKGLATVTLLLPWMVWKHRNACVFEGERPSVSGTCDKIRAEASIWARAGALGLRAVLPVDWHVR